MSGTCDYFDCDRPQMPDQSPRPSAQLCAEHDAEINSYIEAGDTRAIVRFGVRVLTDPLARKACREIAARRHVTEQERDGAHE